MKTIKKLIACFAFLVLTITAAFTDEVHVAKIIAEDGIETEYDTFQEALNAWRNETTLTLLSDVTVSSIIRINRSVNGSYTLDLNDHGIMFTGDYNNLCFDISSGVSLTINDNATMKTDRYITLNAQGRGVSVSDNGSEGSTCVKVTGGYITGANNNMNGVIFVNSGATGLSMNGGTIVGNVAQYGGGICVYSNGGTVTIAGDARIIKNTVTGDGGAIFMMEDSINVAGAVQITDNKKSNGVTNNVVFFSESQRIEFSGSLDPNARIGVTRSGGIITNGLNGNASNAKGSVSNFISDNPAYTVALNSSGEAFLASLVTVTANADPNNTGTYYATFYNSSKKYVTDSNTEVYYATANANGKLTLTKVESKIIKAGEGVILKSTSTTVALTETRETASYDSILTGSDTATTVTNALVLSNGENGVHFYKYSGSVAAHKAYISE